MLLCASLATAPRGRQRQRREGVAALKHPPPKDCCLLFSLDAPAPRQHLLPEKVSFHNLTSPAWSFCGPEPR